MKYDLGSVLLFSIMAVLSGATSYRKIERYIHNHRKRLNKLCNINQNDLLVQLKHNQRSLHDAMVEHTKKQRPDGTDRMHDQGKRNRIETRDASIWSLLLGSGTESWHGHFKTLICIHRLVERFDTRKKDWQTTSETAYYLCTRNINAKEANQVVRNHWDVENRVHHIRDTRMDEDASRIRKNPCIFGLLRSFALNLMRFNKIENKYPRKINLTKKDVE